MKLLKPPIQNVDTGEIFEACVKNYTDEEKKARLLSCKHLVETDTKSYRELVPQKIDSFSTSILPATVSTSEMAKIYDEKFAKANTVGRKYYDAIIAQADHGICPICGIRLVSTLDHYLPKSRMPTLAVEPTNLIPSCRDCNMDKKATVSSNPRETSVHIYFDRLPNEPWLYVNIGTCLEVTYYVSCPSDWDECLRGRVEHHLEIYHLYSLYSAHAICEITDNLALWKKLVCLGAEERLLEHIKEVRGSAELNDMNSWKAALYRGLECDYQKIVLWLQNKS